MFYIDVVNDGSENLELIFYCWWISLIDIIWFFTGGVSE